MDKIEVRYGGRLGLLRSLSRNMDGTVTINYGKVAEVNMEEWMRATRRESAAMMKEVCNWAQLVPTIDSE